MKSYVIRSDEPCPDHNLGWHDWTPWIKWDNAAVQAFSEGKRLTVRSKMVRRCKICGGHEHEAEE